MADPSTYTVGWICALTKELVAAKSFFDEEHAVTLDVQDPADNNSYSFGRMGKHDVVVASLPMSVYGTVSAATVARDMLRTFPNIRVGLMVGIGGGAPSPQHDIRLGDVVVSTPSGTRGGVLHYSRGKAVQHQEFQLTGSLNQPPQILLTAVGALGADYKMKGHELEERIQEVLSKLPRLQKEYARPVAAEDRLYEISHIHRKSPESAACKDNCGEENLVTREARGDDEDSPMIHYGLIASADILDKDATIRDKLAREQGVLCFEMEAAGLMNHFPCLIIRGICDYSDTHKNDEWQCFAAMTAAAYAKELLQRIPPTKIREQEPLAKVLGRIGIKLENITTNVRDTNATENTMNANNRRLEMERWLRPPRSLTNVAKAQKRRHDGTGQWFIQSPAFTEFKAGSRKHLWLHGLAGCGKTVLSSQILDDLSATDGIITLVHYFDFNDVEKQSLDGLLRSLAFQLYQNGGQDAPAKLHELFKSCGDGSRDPGESQLESCIKSMLSTVDRVFILIDALDECKSRDPLLSWIGQFTVENVQLLLTARPEEDIQTQVVRFFGKENCLGLDKPAVNSDIKSYVRFVLDTNPRFMEKGLGEELRNQILTKVGDGADAMFRWAACQMDTLEACLTPNAVREALASLPHDLPMTYDRMLESIPPHYKGDSIRLLQFIVNCEHPLSPAEAVEILATRPSQHQDRLKFDPQDRLFKSSNIVRALSGACDAGRTEIARLLLQHAKADHKAIELEARTSRPSPGSHDQLNCDEYLDNSLFFSVRSGNEHLVQMLLDNVFDLSRLVDLRQDSEDPATFYAQNALLNALKGCHQRVITTLLDAMLNHAHTHDYATLRAASEVRNHYILQSLSIALGNSPPTFVELMNQIHGVFLGEHKQIQQSLLKKAGRHYFQRIETEFGVMRLCTPIEVAARIGSAEIVSQLLQAGVVLYVDTPLDIAVIYGHERVVRVLLDYITDKNITLNRAANYPFWNYYSQKDRNDSIVRMFLDLGIDHKYVYDDESTPLHQAAQHGDVNLVERLLSLGHAVDLEDAFYRTPLHSASSIDVKRVLLAAGANANAFDVHGLTPLHTAARSGAIEEMELLLQSGASISVMTKKGLAILDVALSYEHSSDSTVLRTTKFLLDRGLGANDKNEKGAIPLHYACATSRVDAAMLLIKKGADVNAKDIEEKTPFQWAARGYVSKATVDLLSMLMDHGADANSQDDKGFTALHHVDLNSRNDYPIFNYQYHLADMAELLLDYGVDVDARDKEGKTALYWFLERGQLAAAEILIKRGANVKALGDYGEKMLHAMNDNTLSFPKLVPERLKNTPARSNIILMSQTDPEVDSMVEDTVTRVLAPSLVINQT
ncbi:hypothetical protein FANTH_7259 [Fusarium anthophilum]|uniref:Nephrocystin 3-like N-terminal domain-containing protein n=1 Tax=Fusarium anthophilum TaxID=48485 RepID=A0A8H4ZF48_9HYPO|nr:hypothetical protein FANTH_7259 [Fusarium anthophilum]